MGGVTDRLHRFTPASGGRQPEQTQQAWADEHDHLFRLLHEAEHGTGDDMGQAPLGPGLTPKRGERLPSSGASYQNCAAAHAAGAAPLYRGDPGYRSQLDRDGDGVACE